MTPDLGVIYRQIANKSYEEHKTLADKNSEEEGPTDGRQVHLEKRDKKEYGKRIFPNKDMEAFRFCWPWY